MTERPLGGTDCALGDESAGRPGYAVQELVLLCYWEPHLAVPMEERGRHVVPRGAGWRPAVVGAWASATNGRSRRARRSRRLFVLSNGQLATSYMAFANPNSIKSAISEFQAASTSSWTCCRYVAVERVR